MENSENFDAGYKCCFTGYRPEKLPFDIGVEDKAYIDFDNTLILGIKQLLDEGCRTFYTGMAMGFDIICAETILLLKKASEFPLKLICVIPYADQSDGYSPEWRERYDKVLKESDEKVILADRYYKGCFQNRNRFMVDNSDFVLTWFDGKAGGTKNTVDYAVKKQKYVFNLYNSEDYTIHSNLTFEIFE